MQPHWRAPAQFLLVTFVITYALWFGTMALVRVTGVWLEGLAVIGPALAAFWMVRSKGPFRWLGGQLRDAHFRLWWFLVPVAMFMLASATIRSLGAPIIPAWQTAIFLFVIQTLLAALPEEIGWRGYLTPALLRVSSPLTTSLVVGIAWGLWHAQKLAAIPLLPLLCVSLSILMTYACVRLKGELPLAILIHGSFNAATFWADDHSTVEQAFAMLDIVIAILSLAAAVLLIVKRDWFLASPMKDYSNSTMTSPT